MAHGLHDADLGYDFVAMLLVEEATGDRILVAVSGGKDSTALAYALAAARRAFKKDFTLSAVHISTDFCSCCKKAALAERLEGWGIPFDDVFVPNERIFLDGDTKSAGALALTFVEYHRFTAISYKLPLVDVIVGAAATISDFNGIPKEVDKTDFYQHDQNWSNRMILGDSLQVMASLAEREGLRGKVQCIYIDPPYGIKFNS